MPLCGEDPSDTDHIITNNRVVTTYRGTLAEQKLLPLRTAPCSKALRNSASYHALCICGLWTLRACGCLLSSRRCGPCADRLSLTSAVAGGAHQTHFECVVINCARLLCALCPNCDGALSCKTSLKISAMLIKLICGLKLLQTAFCFPLSSHPLCVLFFFFFYRFLSLLRAFQTLLIDSSEAWTTVSLCRGGPMALADDDVLFFELQSSLALASPVMSVSSHLDLNLLVLGPPSRAPDHIYVLYSPSERLPVVTGDL